MPAICSSRTVIHQKVKEKPENPRLHDWITKLEGFLTLNDREILQGAGRVPAELAKSHAEQEFGKFRVLDDQHFESDFDHMVKRLPEAMPR